MTIEVKQPIDYGQPVNVIWNDFCLHADTEVEDCVMDYMDFEGPKQREYQVTVCAYCREEV